MHFSRGLFQISFQCYPLKLTVLGIGLYLENSQKSLIFLARQNKLLEVINSMAIIESEMMSHQQLFLSSQGT